jgi:hypothetical protein
MDFDTPEGRLDALNTLGPEEYNRRLTLHHREQVVETVNGYDIRKIGTRFGPVFQIETTSRAFSSLEDSRTHAEGLSPKR